MTKPRDWESEFKSCEDARDLFETGLAAAKEIDGLREENSALKSGKVDWMSVGDQLPTEDGFYWCYLAECPPQSYPQQAIRWKDGHWFTSWQVSHWRPLMPVPTTGVSR